MGNERQRLLHIYMTDHWAGSGGGVSLAKRIAKENSSNELGHEVSKIAREIEDDQAELERIMGHLGARKRRWRMAGALLGERLARLKPNGKVFRYSPLSRVLELEGLIMGVTGKLQLWRSLLDDEDNVGLDPVEIESLRRRAENQRQRLEQLHARAARQAFGGGQTRTRIDDGVPG